MTWVALSIWPLISVVLFKTLRLPVALIATILGGYLLLPIDVAFDVPALPALDKNSIPAIMSLIMVALMARPKTTYGAIKTEEAWPVQPGLLPRHPVILLLLLLLFLGQLGTAFTNKEPLFYGPLVIPGLRPYDMISALMATAFAMLPFLLGRKVLASDEGQRILATGIVVSAAAYCFLALYEVRMSPQLNRMIYGFFPHDFIQHYRNGGWRPVVFLYHGLQLGIFLSAAVVCAFGLMRSSLEPKQRIIWGLVGFWLFGTLFLAKVLGAFSITVLLLLVMFTLPRRLRITFCAGVVVCVLIYPILRVIEILPFDQILANVSAERAWSFRWRLDNEQILLERANEKPLFGWGGWGRSRVFDETGRDVSTTDGAWVIELGLGGWLRYIALFGLLSWGILSLFWQRGSRINPITVVLAMALTGNMIDLIPNAGLSPVTWLIAGALAGRLEQTVQAPESERSTADPPERVLTYARDFGQRHGPKPTPTSSRTLSYRRNFGDRL